MKKMIIMLLVLLMTVSMLVTGCAKPSDDNVAGISENDTESNDDIETLKIGVITSLTGSLAFAGNEVKNAVEMAVEAKGSVLGREIELVAADAQDATQAVSEFERLYQQGVRYFMGGYGSYMDLSIQKLVDEKGCIFITASGWSDALTETKINNYFQFTPRVATFGERMVEYSAEYAKKYLGIEKEDIKYGLIWNNSTVEYVAQSVLDAFEAEGLSDNIVVKEGYPGDRKDFTTLIAKLQEADVDVLIPCQMSPDGIPFRKKMIEMDYEPPILFAMGLIYDQPDFGDLGAEITDGCLVLSYTHPSINTDAAQGLKEFSDKYEEKFGWVPLTHATQSYSATLFLIDMLEKAGVDDVAEVQKNIVSCDIEAGNYPNYWGIKFDDYHRNIRAGDPLVIGQWQNGELVAVGTDAIKVADAIVPWDASKLEK